MCAGPWRSEEGVRSPGTWVTEAVILCIGVEEEQPGLLTTEPSLGPPCNFFNDVYSNVTLILRLERFLSSLLGSRKFCKNPCAKQDVVPRWRYIGWWCVEVCYEDLRLAGYS